MSYFIKPYSKSLTRCLKKAIKIFNHKDFIAASKLFNDILEENPNHTEAIYYLGLIYFEQTDYRKSIDLFIKVIDANMILENEARLCFLLGTSFYHISIYDKAVLYLSRSVNIEFQNIIYLRNLGKAYLAFGQHIKAFTYFDKILLLKPNIAEIYYDLGCDCFLGNALHQSEIYVTKAILNRPDFSVAYNLLGRIFQAVGKLDEALNAYEKAIQLLPTRAEFYFNYVHCKKISESDIKLLDTLKEIVNLEKNDYENLSWAYFSLGKCYDDLKQFNKAFEYYFYANELEKKEKNLFLDKQKLEIYVNHIITNYNIDLLSKYDTIKTLEKIPIFIIGMPRSGTTLVAQALSMHSNIENAGELLFFTQQLLLLDFDLTQSLQQDDINKLTNNFLSIISRFDSMYVIDKMPGNFFRVALIFICFPNARIIHCMRNPLDTCLSIYFQKFDDLINHSSSLEDLAFYYTQYERLMEHWNHLFKNKILNVYYEDIISNQEHETKRILEFCGLEWDENCIDFHKSTIPVCTASHWQVRQKLYSTSVNRWENYRLHINSLLAMEFRNK